ncbi:aspartate aminotransferase family protein [Halobacillus sp. K22]|uniref:aspartate aminotransferase family protein n=1 Tax=Halobacillus sp. K22 TaxID=3457431 RepID=UPI003FCE872B
MNHSWLIKPVFEDFYPTAAYGEGVFIYDDQGNKYLDGSSGAVTASIGHAVPEVVDAVTEQAKKISFVYRSQFTSSPAEQLAEKLNDLAFGADDPYYSFFVNSGSEANETALKIAVQYWQEQGKYQKHKIISRWTSYHGITMGALSMSGHTERRKRFVPMLEGFPSISPPYCYRRPSQESCRDFEIKCADELDAAIRRTGAEQVAAFIAEPIIGAAGGVIVPSVEYYKRIKEICDYHHVLFIADEVMTGIGRTGKTFAMEHYGVKPDILTLGKGMSAGYAPIAAALIHDRVLEPIRKGSKAIIGGHTYSANPQSTAAALAVLTFIEKHQLVDRSAENGAYLLNQLRNLALTTPIIGDVRGKGMLVGIEFVSHLFTKTPFPKHVDLTHTLVQRARDKGLLIYPASAGIEGGDGDAVIISPPLTISKQEMDTLVTLLQETIHEVQRELMLKGYMNSTG